MRGVNPIESKEEYQTTDEAEEVTHQGDVDETGEVLHQEDYDNIPLISPEKSQYTIREVYPIAKW